MVQQSPTQHVPHVRALRGRELALRVHEQDTLHEVTIMGKTTSAPDRDTLASCARFRKLPERIRPEDMIAVQETEPPPDPTMGRDTELDFMLRNAGF